MKSHEVLSIFLASPSDLAEERAGLKQVIDELNLAWSDYLGMRLELLVWETRLSRN